MDRWTDGWKIGWLDGWIYKQVDDKWIGGYTDGWINAQIWRQIINRQTDRQEETLGVLELLIDLMTDRENNKNKVIFFGDEQQYH